MQPAHEQVEVPDELLDEVVAEVDPVEAAPVAEPWLPEVPDEAVPVLAAPLEPLPSVEPALTDPLGLLLAPEPAAVEVAAVGPHAESEATATRTTSGRRMRVRWRSRRREGADHTRSVWYLSSLRPR